jgi:ethanolamine utilization microcompartment shell protein EutL
VHAGAAAILHALGKSNTDISPPKILASTLVTNVDDQHAFLMNRNKLGSMVLGGDSIYLLECQSAAYAILASNEAEKEADVKLIDMRMIGANGRLYLAGTEADVRNAMNAAEMALRDAGAT